MDAKQLINRRIILGAHGIAHVVVWEVPKPVPASLHGFKYRLAYVVRDVCVLRYDNEAGKGDHKHIGESEHPYVFSDIDRLIDDFLADIERWNNENSYF